MIRSFLLPYCSEKTLRQVNYLNKIICLLIYFLVFACTETHHSMTSQPYLSQVTEHSMVVSWHTPVPTPSVVEYGETKAHGHMVKIEGKTQFHSVTLTDLRPSDNILLLYSICKTDTGLSISQRQLNRASLSISRFMVMHEQIMGLILQY